MVLSVVARPDPRRAAPTCCLCCVSLHAGGKGRQALGAAAGLLQQESICIEGDTHPWCSRATCTHGAEFSPALARQGGAPVAAPALQALASEMNQTVIARLTWRLEESGDVAIGGGCRDRHSCAMRQGACLVEGQGRVSGGQRALA